MRLNIVHRGGLRLSLTPLIDVVFLLLLFFMLSSTFLKLHALPVSTANNSVALIASDQAAIVVVIETDTAVVDGKVVDASTLGDVLAQVSEGETTRTVLVRPARALSLQRLVSVMEGIREAGFTNISLQDGQ